MDAHLVRTALANALSTPTSARTKQALHRARSRDWVESLAAEFRRVYSGADDVRVFSKHNEANRTDFGLNELLYDVSVCRVAPVESARHRKQLWYVRRALWQVESEFARDSRAALVDFNKLVLGSAENKLFVGPRTNDDAAFLRVLLPAARACRGDVFVALVPHPAAWDEGLADAARVWRLRDGEWVGV